MRPSRSLRRARRRAPSLSSSRFHPRGLSLSLPLDIGPPLFPRVPSLFFIPPFPLARSPMSILCCTLSLSLGFLSHSSLLSSPFPFVSARPPLFSRHCSSFVASLSAAVYNHPLTLARSVLIESATRSPPRRAAACIFAFFSLSLSTLSDAPSLSLSVSVLLCIFLSLSLSPFSSLFFSLSFSLCPAFFFL